MHLHNKPLPPLLHQRLQLPYRLHLPCPQRPLRPRRLLSRSKLRPRSARLAAPRRAKQPQQSSNVARTGGAIHATSVTLCLPAKTHFFDTTERSLHSAVVFGLYVDVERCPRKGRLQPASAYVEAGFLSRSSTAACCEFQQLPFAALFTGHMKRPDFLLLLESVGFIIIDVKECRRTDRTTILGEHLWKNVPRGSLNWHHQQPPQNVGRPASACPEMT